MENIKKAIELLEEIEKVRESEPLIIGVQVGVVHKSNVQLKEKEFKKLFKSYSVRPFREDAYELYVEMGNVEVIAIGYYEDF